MLVPGADGPSGRRRLVMIIYHQNLALILSRLAEIGSLTFVSLSSIKMLACESIKKELIVPNLLFDCVSALLAIYVRTDVPLASVI